MESGSQRSAKLAQFTLADFERLKKKYGVTWVIVERPGVVGLSCPYANNAVMVCRIP
jgi:hypothetical protein